MDPAEYKFASGLERVYWAADAASRLPMTLDFLGYERAVIFSSRTLNRTTPAVSRIADALGGRLIALSDEVGEHAPMTNILKGIQTVEAAHADVIVCIGGGSISDFGKIVQLGVTTGVSTREALIDWKTERGEDGLAFMPPESFGPVALRQIAIPTTFSTAEMTAISTPVNDVTGEKVMFAVRQGAPRAVIYDPDLLRFTPPSLLAATGIRGFDHAVSNVISVQPNPFGSVLSRRAMGLFNANLQAAANGTDRDAVAQCQFASYLTALSNPGSVRGFSLHAVHVLGPWAKVSHGNAACVMLLAQARWFCAVPDEGMTDLSGALGRPGESFDAIVLELLRSLDLPTSLADLGVTGSQIGELAEVLFRHPGVTRNNRRPIRTLSDVMAVLNSVATS